MQKTGVSKRSFSQPSALSIVHSEVSTREVQALALLMTSALSPSRCSQTHPISHSLKFFCPFTHTFCLYWKPSRSCADGLRQTTYPLQFDDIPCNVKFQDPHRCVWSWMHVACLLLHQTHPLLLETTPKQIKSGPCFSRYCALSLEAMVLPRQLANSN